MPSKAVSVTAAAIGAFAFLVIAPSQAQAAASENCAKNALKLCGEVHNGSHLTMHTTVDLGKGTDHCDVWNYDGGTMNKWVYAKCTQKSLVSGGSRGGGTTDVDALTFNKDAYMLDFHGTLLWKDKGVWTKIHNNETASCGTDASFGIPFCRIVWDF
ncbi:hypothetical protein ACQEU6_18305 [Spirillospora sp. CA-108201]